MTDDERDTRQRAQWAAQKRRQRANRKAKRRAADPFVLAGWRRNTRGEYVPAKSSQP